MSVLSKKFLGVGLLAIFALCVTAFISSAQSALTADVSDVAKHPDRYVGKRVTVDWKVDRVYSPTVIGLEKNEKHLLVIAPDGFSEQMKKGEPFKGTGVVRKFDKAELAREYKNVHLGKAPLHKIKDVLILGTARSARVEQPQPVAPEQQAGGPTPAPVQEAQNNTTSNRTLPRTASPIQSIGLVGLLSLMFGVGIRALRRQNG
jgi:hypothetical protein